MQTTKAPKLKTKRSKISYAKWGYFFIAPFFLAYALFHFAPQLLTIYNSFFENYREGLTQVGPNFVGLKNYIYGIQEMDFLSSFWYSLVITVSSVALILLCCSMCAWYITRVQNTLSKGMYYLCVFSMIVPFQMVMFTLAKTADTLKLNNPYNICIIYLGFGAGLAVFMFTGFVKSMPIAIEEAAMIDGCNPIQIFFKVVCPILKPTMISTAILETMWVWNDYLLPTLVLDIKTYRTIPMAIQYFRGSYGKVEMAPMMACIMITVLPVIVLYLICQKYIIDGVVAGAVKG